METTFLDTYTGITMETILLDIYTGVTMETTLLDTYTGITMETTLLDTYIRLLALSSASLRPILWDGGRDAERNDVASQPTKVFYRANKNRWITETVDGASYRTGTEVGAVLTAVTANDVDSNPALTYHFSSPGEAPDDPAEPSEEEEGGSPPTFSIDRFSGKVTLVRGLDFESRREHRLRVTASDTAHAAHTVLTVRVTDENDNRPQFGRSAYLASLPPGW
uniref:Cadherin domain-containing protein n=1 Tax=Timema bartmani TaxID=61472 RepID=A0A7R9HVV2_9NEOP|nr:unnamed protein product [Timema bartmani]